VAETEADLLLLSLLLAHPDVLPVVLASPVLLEVLDPLLVAVRAAVCVSFPEPVAQVVDDAVVLLVRLPVGVPLRTADSVGRGVRVSAVEREPLGLWLILALLEVLFVA
jgi:hypothetical protein